MSDQDLIIRDVKAKAVFAPLARPITTAVGIIPSAPLVLINVLTDQGIVGHAYIFGYSPVSLGPLVQLIDNLAEGLRGKTIAPVSRMNDFASEFRLLGRQGFLGMAISGLDMAFWDALAKAQDMPLARLLGGEETPIPAYDSFGVIDPERDLHVLENSLAQGFKAIKIKIGDVDLKRDLEVVAAVREIIGSDIQLMVDYNQSLNVPEAIYRINRLSEYDLLWVEEPVPAEDLAGHASVRNSCHAPIQTGENWWFPEDATRAISAGASDFAMLDLMKIGGVTGWMRAAGLAQGASLPVSSHIFAEASAHVLAVTPTAHYLEYLDIAGCILKDPVQIEDGALRPKGPGLGITWDNAAVRKYAM
jgi:mandelate racemase